MENGWPREGAIGVIMGKGLPEEDIGSGKHVLDNREAFLGVCIEQ